MRSAKRLLTLLTLLIPITRSQAQEPADIVSARTLLSKERSEARQIKKEDQKIAAMIHLGLWDEATSLIRSARPGNDIILLQADLLFLENRFPEAESLTDQVLAHNRSNQLALVIKLRLQIQAWALNEATATAQELIKRNEKNLDPQYLLGQIYLLKQNYPAALGQARFLQTVFINEAAGYLLEAKVLLATNKWQGVTGLINKATALDPMNADAWFHRGYLEWRSGRRAQLSAMQAAWSFALELDPLNYKVHWHKGNGYTASTYADYTGFYDPQTMQSLNGFEALLEAHDYPAALRLARRAGGLFPRSPVPLLYAGSCWYQQCARFTRSSGPIAALDSAELAFQKALSLAPTFGPAHNGLAAVINARQLGFLSFHDSVEKALDNIGLSSKASLDPVFPKLQSLGTRVPAMVFTELHSARAYLPLLQLEGLTFVIPPLHRTLAESMHTPSLNTAVTFDNRKWMDIRGVGSGATGIEYVLAGVYHERNVLLHEFVHLFHENVLTEVQQRRIRVLYFNAVRQKATLDYYAAGNEDEYFAQIYEAYSEPTKVHPLDYKSMNTRATLKSKDPSGYAFVDSLSQAALQYLGGSVSILKDNYAQVYTLLARQELVKPHPDPLKIKDFIEKGTAWNPAYMPLLLAKAKAAISQKDYTAAESILRSAESKQPELSSIYTENAELNKALFSDGLLEENEAFELRNSYLTKALSLEKDLQLATELFETYQAFLTSTCRNGMAVTATTAFISRAPQISSYQRESFRRIKARLAWLRAQTGDPAGLDSLQTWAEQSQDLDLAMIAAEAYEFTREPGKGATILKLPPFDESGPDLPRRAEHLAALLAEDGQLAEAHLIMEKIPVDSSAWYARALLETGQPAKALNFITALHVPTEPLDRSFFFQTIARIYLVENKTVEAISNFRKALDANNYDLYSAGALKTLYERTGRHDQANSILQMLSSKGINPGTRAPESLKP